jgi:hypothetical protein
VDGERLEIVAARISDLWRYYDEHALHARQHEDLRAKATSTMTAIAAAMVGFAGVNGIGSEDVTAGVMIVLVSMLGSALNIKHYERFKFHSKVLGECRKEIDALRATKDFPLRTTNDIRRQANEEHAAEFTVLGKKGPSPWVGGVRLNLLWLGLPLTVGLIGCVLVALSIAAWIQGD